LLTYGTNLVAAVLSLLNVLIVSRVLGPSGRGDVAFLTAITWFTANLVTFGIQEANVNIAGSEPRARRSLATNSVVFASFFGVATLGVLAVLITAVPAIGGPVDPTLRWATLAFVPVMILATYMRFLIQADYGFGITNLAWLVTPTVNVFVNGALAAVGALSVGTAVFTWLAGQTIGCALLVWDVWRKTGFGPIDVPLGRRAFGFGARAHAGRMMLLGNYRLDQWILGAVAGSQQLGTYSVAVAWAEALWYLPTSLAAVQRPDLVRATREAATRQAAAAFRAATLITVFLGGLMVIAAPFLCVTIFGSGFEDSIDDLRILVLGAVGMIALKQLGNALTAQRKPVLTSIAIGIAFAATVALDVLLIPDHGGAGAALASTIAYSVGGVAIGAIFLWQMRAPISALVPRRKDVALVWDRARALRRPELRHVRRRPVKVPGPVPATPSPVFWAIIGVTCGLAIGAAARVSGLAMLGVGIALSLVILLVRRPPLLLPVLTSTVFLELISVGGVRISRVVAPIALVVVAIALLRGYQFATGPPLLWATLYSTWAIASGMWTVDMGATVHQLLSLAIALTYMAAFATLLRGQRDFKVLLWIIAPVSALLGVLSILAFTSHPILGFTTQAGRAQGATGDPNFFATAQLVALPLILVLAVHTESVWRRAVLSGALILNIASVFSTVSRGGTIQLFVIAALLLFLPAETIFRSRRQKAIVLIVLVVGGGFFFQRYSAALTPRLLTIFQSDQTGSGRKEFWAAAEHSISQRPIFGLGYGGFGVTSNELMLDTPDIDLSHWTFRPNGSEAHNAFLGTTADLGYVGLFFFVGMLGSTALMLRRTARRAYAIGDRFTASAGYGLAIALAGWCIGSMFISTETSRPLWIMVGLCLALPRLVGEHASDVVPEPSRHPYAPRKLAVRSA
jgi:O-antigen/teichoic acid export membrane protein/O-antigen ligase